MDSWKEVNEFLNSGKSGIVTKGGIRVGITQHNCIELENAYDFIQKWKQLVSNGESPIDIDIPGYGTFTNCTALPEANGYTIQYDEYKEE